MTDLSTVWADQIQWSHGAVEKTRDLHEVIVSNGPRTIDQESQVGLGLPAH